MPKACLRHDGRGTCRARLMVGALLIPGTSGEPHHGAGDRFCATAESAIPSLQRQLVPGARSIGRMEMARRAIEVRPIAGALGAEIGGGDLREIDDDDAVAAIRKAWLE